MLLPIMYSILGEVLLSYFFIRMNKNEINRKFYEENILYIMYKQLIRDI